MKYFNPRARVGRDLISLSARRVREISIHAPAWGATESLWVKGVVQEFQSTRPRGARRVACN